MAEKKISELNSLTGANAATGDLLPIVDVSATETKKITRAELFTSVSGLTTTGDVTVGGDLTVNGTTTTINTQTLDVEDKNITVAFGAPDAASADGAGLTVDGANATFTYTSADDSWNLNKGLNVPSVDINGGTIDGTAINSSTIDGTVIGGSTPAAISGTTGQFGTSLNVDGTITSDGLTVDGGSTLNGLIEIGGATASLVTGSPNPHIFRTTTGGGYAFGELVLQSRSNASGRGIYLATGATPANRLKVSDTGDISFYEDTGTTPKFFWDASAERLGIGTSSPSSSLFIAYDSATANDWVDAGQGLTIRNNSATKPTSLKLTSVTAANGHQIVWGGGTGDSHLAFKNYNSERMRISSGGDISFYEDTGTTPKFFWDASAESLGIGTSSPFDQLHQYLPSGTTYRRIQNGSVTIREYASTAVDTGAYGTSSNHPLAFTTNNTERMRIDSSGNVLVGTTTSPSGSGQIVANGGVYLGGTGSANLLDDYEVGTWTPASSELGNLAIEKAQYTKIGRQVHLFAQFASDSTAPVNLDASFIISGVPFPPSTFAPRGLGGVIQLYSSHGNSRNALADVVFSENLNCEIIVVRGSFNYDDCTSITVNITYNTTA